MTELAPGENLEQTLVASPNWQTQVFLLLHDYDLPRTEPLPDTDIVRGRRANLAEASILLSAGSGFKPFDEQIYLTEIARLGLANRRPMLPRDIRQMLAGKFNNPMLGIFGAHLLLLQDEPDRSLLRIVLDNLRKLLGREHPDVEAIALRVDGPGDYIFTEPPMLLRSWGFVLDATVEKPMLCPVDSFATRIATQVWGGDLWMQWRPPVVPTVMGGYEDEEVDLRVYEKAIREWLPSQFGPEMLGGEEPSSTILPQEWLRRIVQITGLPRARVEQIIGRIGTNEPVHFGDWTGLTQDVLSARQKDILTYIEDFMSRHGFPPAIRQIQETLGISSTSVVAYNLKALEGKGLLKRQSKVARSITLSHAIPMYGSRRRGAIVPLLGVVTAGLPLTGPEEIATEAAETIEVPAELAPPEQLKNVYALRVRGQTMLDALIDDGDIVLLRYQETAENGQLVAARIEDQNAVTLKKFYREGNRVKLQPANTTMEPIYVDAANVRIQGRVVGVLRRLVSQIEPTSGTLRSLLSSRVRSEKQIDVKSEQRNTQEYLTARQREILDYLEQYVVEHGYPPLIREIQAGLKITSASSVRRSLNALEAHGLIKREGGIQRGITVAESYVAPDVTGKLVEVPLLGILSSDALLRTIHIELFDTTYETITVSPDFIPESALQEVYALRVHGNGLRDVLIDDGDIVLYVNSDTAQNGQLVAALNEDQQVMVLKRLYHEGSHIRLQSVDPAVVPIYLDQTKVHVQGIVIGVIRIIL